MNKNKIRIIATFLSIFLIEKSSFKNKSRLVLAMDNNIKNLSNIKMRLQDDFYTNVNEIWIQSRMRQNCISDGTHQRLQKTNDNAIFDIINEILSTQNGKGTTKHKLANFFQSAIDMESRNKQGINSIKKYLDLYNNAKDLNELLKADFLVSKETGYSCLISISVEIDAKDSDKNILEISALTNHLQKHIIDSEDVQKAYEKFITRLLELSGENSEKTKLDAKKITKFEKILSDSSLEVQDLYDVDKVYNVFSIEELNKLYPNLNISRILENMGFKNIKFLRISDINKFKKSYEYFSEENFDTLRLYAKTRILINYGRYLSQEFTDALNDLENIIFGVEGKTSIEASSLEFAKENFQDNLGKIFIEKYFGNNIIKNIENMFSEIKQIYEEKIKNSNWISKKAQIRAIKKLNNMKAKIGYPEKWSDKLDVDIKNYKNGGSYFSNICEVQKNIMKKYNKELNEPADKTKWQMPIFGKIPVYKVNAFYNPQSNDIILPAGILRYPFYDEEASYEQNMAGIGVIIAHEISHAFDPVGSKFDENGNAVNWWTDEDRENLKKRYEKFITAYDNLEIAEGVKSNGKLTLYENIADVGAISCILDILSKKENPNYEEFFKHYAKIRRFIGKPKIIEKLSKEDVHSASKIRTNRTLANFEEFHKVFNIKEGDKMYVAPEERVSLW